MRKLSLLFGALCLVYAAVFYLGALLHAGVVVGALREPFTPPAVLVETLCGSVLVAAGYGTLAGRRWASRVLVDAHAVALGGVLIGTLAVALGEDTPTAYITGYHRGMAVLLALGLGGAIYLSRSRR
ncbi:hypothetical protein [Nonomuraea sp. NPDC046570]|uniref:hypothetical protein n=1 Tax=Nonomuraea sp. NPDC046570 TaxID=3155255 RepID=UPI0033D0F279